MCLRTSGLPGKTSFLASDRERIIHSRELIIQSGPGARMMITGYTGWRICIVLAGRGAARWDGVSKWPGKVSEGGWAANTTPQIRNLTRRHSPSPAGTQSGPRTGSGPPLPLPLPRASGQEAPALTPDPSVGDSREPVPSESYCFSSVLLGNSTLSGIFSFHKLLGSVCDQRVT